MIIKVNISLYICEHCKKRMFRKHAMEKHEAACYSNPDNFRACSGCIHLEEIETTYWADVRSFGDNYGVIEDVEERKTKGFRCKKLNKEMYPYKAEKKKLPERFPESFEGKEPMPKSCEQREDEWSNIDADINW